MISIGPPRIECDVRARIVDARERMCRGEPRASIGMTFEQPHELRRGLGIAHERWWAVGAWVCCMQTAWAIGEAVGYLAGPGHTLDAWV